LAGTINADTLKADSNLKLQIASANVAFIDANGLTIVGNSLNIGGGRIVVTANSAIINPTITTPTISGISGNLSFDSTGTTGFNTATANTIRVHTTGVERVRVGPTGNVGIGTITPAYRLDVNGSLTTNGSEEVMRIAGANSSQSGGINIKSVYGASATDRVTTISSIDGQGQASPLAFASGNTEQMRFVKGVDASGKGVLLINETSQSQSPMLQITGSAADYNLLTIKQTLTTYSSGARLVMFLNSTDTIAGVISHSGATSVTYGTTSDQRLKENIVDAPNALDKVLNIKVRSYDWKEDSSHVEYGLVAQEVNQVYGEPIGVGGEDIKKELWNIEYGRLTPILLKAIQEQQAIISNLKARIEALEA
jgi:hypothetical protein